MRILLVASGEFAVPTLRRLVNDGHEIACVVTQPDRKAGRGQKTKPTPIKERAGELGLDVLEADDINAPGIVQRLASLGARVGIVVAFGQKIGSDLLAALPAGFINLHASLLPKYRGAAPFQWAVINGEEKSGVTVFRLTERMDAGAILESRPTHVKPEETADELHDRLARIGPDAVTAALEQFAGDRIPEGAPQDPGIATKAPKLRKEDGFIDFAEPAGELANRICGLWSWPGAACEFVSADGSRKERVMLARARVGDPQPADVPSGTIDVRLYVATGDGWLELLEIKPSGGKRMRWQAYVTGRHVTAGDRFVRARSRSSGS